MRHEAEKGGETLLRPQAFPTWNLTANVNETITDTPHHTPAALPRPSRWIAKNVLAMERTKSRPLSRPNGVKTCSTDLSQVVHVCKACKVNVCSPASSQSGTTAADSLWVWLQALLTMMITMPAHVQKLKMGKGIWSHQKAWSRKSNTIF